MTLKSPFLKFTIFMAAWLLLIASCAASPLDSRTSVCETAECKKAAKQILKNMDVTVNPCHNFYRFACGKFMNKTIIPNTASNVSVFNRKNAVLQKKVKQTIEGGLEEGDPKTFELLQSYYNVCLNAEKIKETSMKDVNDILTSLGNWPVLVGKTWNESNFDWQHLIYQLRKMGYIDSAKSLIIFDVEVHQKNTSRNILILDQGSTGINKEYLQKGLENKIVQAYYKYIVELAKIFGANPEEAEKELADSLNFEIELAKISLTRQERRNMSQLFNLKTVEHLESEYPYIPWNEYLNHLVSPQSQVDHTDEVIVKVPSFFKSLSQLLSKTPKRVLANYIISRVVQESVEYMNDAVRRIEAEFTASLTGTTAQQPRSVQCLSYVSTNLHLAMGAMYVRKNFDKQTKTDVENLVKEFRESFKKMLKKTDWMDEETKKAALVKLDAMQSYVAYPDEFYDNEMLDGYYTNLKVDKDSFLRSHLNLNRFNLGYKLEQLRKPVNKTSWITHGRSAWVNAYYVLKENAIQIPVGILQDGIFSSSRLNYMNFGGVGWVIGHEITHGFDDQGSQYDKDGNLANWWNTQSQKEYSKRTQCILDQYSNYSIEEVGLNINGKNTLGENIADNGALKEAYLAYENFNRYNGEEPLLPGLPYSQRQLFWISAANIMCNKRRYESLKDQVITDVHAPHEFRVIGTFSNMPEFSKDFNCPVGSPMNPTDKCTVWAKKTRSTLFPLCNSIFFVAVGLPSIYPCSSSPLGSQIQTCKTAGCNEAAQQILQNMDPTTNPCDNFYQFACGKFVKETPIPDDQSDVSLFAKIEDSLQQKLKKSVEGQLEDGDPKVFKLLQSFYNVCLNTGKIEKNGVNEVNKILNDLGGWPVLLGESWNESNFDWRKLIYQLRKIGYTSGSMKSLIGFYIALDQKNNSRNVITLDQAATGIRQEYLSKGMENKIVQAYHKYKVELAKVLGADHEEAKKELAEALNFEFELAKISVPKEERRNSSKLYNLKTVGQLQSEYPNIPWVEYFNQLVSPKSHVDLTDEVVVKVPTFIRSLAELLTKTPKRVLANYILGSVVQESASFINEQARKIEAEFDTALTGATAQKPRWVTCIDYVSSNLPLATGALYVRKNFNEKTKKDVSELVNRLRESFKDMLNKIDWMDAETKKAALIKLNLIRPYVAYPDEFFDNEKLDKYFENLEVDAESFLKSDLNLNLFNWEHKLEELRKPIAKTSWITHGRSAVVNAFYTFLENSIQIPAGILQDGVFSSNWPSYMNYGSAGWMLGHELTHGFDDQGSQYDKDGNLINWWSIQSRKEYSNRAQCIIDQYGNYTVKEVGLNINGKNTQGENIADNGAVKEAYFAYENYERENGEELPLPGLPYSPRQLFWISGANIWCTRRRENAQKNLILTGVHTPEEYRVNGPFSNMPQFSKDFNCPLGSPMNPIKKCTVW